MMTETQGRMLTQEKSQNGLRFWDVVQRDFQRHYGGFSKWSAIRAVIAKHTFAPVFSLRLYAAVAQRGGVLFRITKPFLKLFHRWACRRLSIELPLGTTIGPGLRIIHGFGLVINKAAIIGEDVTLFQGVTIGQKDVISQNGRFTVHSRIGDKVTIAPYGQVIGVTIETGARVGPLTVVPRDVVAGSIVAGNPMKVLREGAEPDVTYGRRDSNQTAPSSLHGRR